ncbi:hypothetical protein HYS50_03355 [Candidatus Woesearchaeota archaeon]|nr:hypothetical protein [Candidatus Woesearchaeota archaeon]
MAAWMKDTRNIDKYAMYFHTGKNDMFSHYSDTKSCSFSLCGAAIEKMVCITFPPL